MRGIYPGLSGIFFTIIPEMPLSLFSRQIQFYFFISDWLHKSIRRKRPRVVHHRNLIDTMLWIRVSAMPNTIRACLLQVLWSLFRLFGLRHEVRRKECSKSSGTVDITKVCQFSDFGAESAHSSRVYKNYDLGLEHITSDSEFLGGRGDGSSLPIWHWKYVESMVCNSQCKGSFGCDSVYSEYILQGKDSSKEFLDSKVKNIGEQEFALFSDSRGSGSVDDHHEQTDIFSAKFVFGNHQIVKEYSAHELAEVSGFCNKGVSSQSKGLVHFQLDSAEFCSVSGFNCSQKMNLSCGYTEDNGVSLWDVQTGKCLNRTRMDDFMILDSRVHDFQGTPLLSAIAKAPQHSVAVIWDPRIFLKPLCFKLGNRTTCALQFTQDSLRMPDLSRH